MTPERKKTGRMLFGETPSEKLGDLADLPYHVLVDIADQLRRYDEQLQFKLTCRRTWNALEMAGLPRRCDNTFLLVHSVSERDLLRVLCQPSDTSSVEARSEFPVDDETKEVIDANRLRGLLMSLEGTTTMHLSTLNINASFLNFVKSIDVSKVETFYSSCTYSISEEEYGKMIARFASLKVFNSSDKLAAHTSGASFFLNDSIFRSLPNLLQLHTFATHFLPELSDETLRYWAQKEARLEHVFTPYIVTSFTVEGLLEFVQHIDAMQHCHYFGIVCHRNPEMLLSTRATRRSAEDRLPASGMFFLDSTLPDFARCGDRYPLFDVELIEDSNPIWRFTVADVCCGRALQALPCDH